MCLLVFAWDCHPRYQFVFAGNRDEFHSRPARPAQWWEGQDLLAGRDEQAGGTWLGVRSDGRFAVVTNFREMHTRRDDARSRGELVNGYLQGNESFRSSHTAEQYNGFNLILGDLGNGPLAYQSNRGEPCEIEPGLHGLSNHQLDTPWPKVTRATKRLRELMKRPSIEADGFMQLLADPQQAKPAELPDTGIGYELEQLLSSVFIVSPDYGTRCSTVVLLDRDGRMQFVERRFDRAGKNVGESRFAFQIR
ncbi:MAG: NRDE family protein [Gammaproteobacteria bacterium]|nr:NRDE family protein [Gammaproteobacteria bacterium]